MDIQAEERDRICESVCEYPYVLSKRNSNTRPITNSTYGLRIPQKTRYTSSSFDLGANINSRPCIFLIFEIKSVCWS